MDEVGFSPVSLMARPTMLTRRATWVSRNWRSQESVGTWAGRDMLVAAELQVARWASLIVST